MVRSTLEYGCLIGDPYTNKNIDKLVSIQKRATCFNMIISPGKVAALPTC
jgi:hypothetical protein